MPTALDALIAYAVTRSAKELANQIAKIVRQAVTAELSAASARRGPGRPRKSELAAPAKSARKSGGKRIRRSAQQLAADDAKILDYVKSHPGQRAGKIEQAVKLPKLNLATGLLRLRAAGKVKAKGSRSTTTYS